MIDLSMEVTTKEMTMTKMSLINLMTNLFLQWPKTTVCRLFEKVFMHYLSIKMPWMWNSKVCTRTKPEPEVSMPWHWNLVNEAIMLLPKGVLQKFTKSMFFLSDIIKIVSDQ